MSRTCIILSFLGVCLAACGGAVYKRHVVKSTVYADECKLVCIQYMKTNQKYVAAAPSADLAYIREWKAQIGSLLKRSQGLEPTRDQAAVQAALTNLILNQVTNLDLIASAALRGNRKDVKTEFMKCCSAMANDLGAVILETQKSGIDGNALVKLEFGLNRFQI